MSSGVCIALVVRASACCYRGHIKERLSSKYNNSFDGNFIYVLSALRAVRLLHYYYCVALERRFGL